MKKLTEAILPTTLIRSQKLNEYLGLDLTIAAETFQHTGSFKFRAAYNLCINVVNAHILAASSGNFGQALAYACKLTGKKCTVVMPDSTARVKIEAVENYGATADLIDTQKISRKSRVEQLVNEIDDVYKASAYDDLFVIAGNSTLGDELSGGDFDAILVPVGGGGLISGVIEGLRRSNSMAAVYGCEPALANDAARSFREGKLIKNEFEPPTIADGARTISLGELNFPIIAANVSDFFEVDDEQIKAAVLNYFIYANLKSEPTGALTLAALISNREKFEGKKVCVIVSGGNVDPAIYAEIVGA